VAAFELAYPAGFQRLAAVRASLLHHAAAKS